MPPLKQTIKTVLKAPLESFAANFGPHQKSEPNKLWVLMYHRILPKSDPRFSSEEPGMIVEPATFQQHLVQLKQLFTILPLSEWVDRHLAGLPLPTNACAITFDDGWLDNYQYALPLITKAQVPVTLFAVPNMIGGNYQFWPNRLTALLQKITEKQLRQLPWLQPYLPVNHPASFSPEMATTVIKAMKAHPDNIINQWLNNAEFECQLKSTQQPSLANWEQLTEMSDTGLVEIGSHTCNHYRLREDLDYAIMKNEIESSKKELQERLGKPVDLFCYPNGDVCPQAISLVKQNYKAAVTTQRGINSLTNPNLYQLSRIGVHQDITNTDTRFKARLSNWL